MQGKDKEPRSFVVSYSAVTSIFKRSGKMASSKGFAIEVRGEGAAASDTSALQYSFVNFSWANEARHLIETLVARRSSRFARHKSEENEKLRAKFGLDEPLEVAPRAHAHAARRTHTCICCAPAVTRAVAPAAHAPLPSHPPLHLPLPLHPPRTRHCACACAAGRAARVRGGADAQGGQELGQAVRDAVQPVLLGLALRQGHARRLRDRRHREPRAERHADAQLDRRHEPLDRGALPLRLRPRPRPRRHLGADGAHARRPLARGAARATAAVERPRRAALPREGLDADAAARRAAARAAHGRLGGPLVLALRRARAAHHRLAVLDARAGAGRAAEPAALRPRVAAHARGPAREERRLGHHGAAARDAARHAAGRPPRAAGLPRLPRPRVGHQVRAAAAAARLRVVAVGPARLARRRRPARHAHPAAEHGGHQEAAAGAAAPLDGGARAHADHGLRDPLAGQRDGAHAAVQARQEAHRRRARRGARRQPTRRRRRRLPAARGQDVARRRRRGRLGLRRPGVVAAAEPRRRPRWQRRWRRRRRRRRPRGPRVGGLEPARGGGGQPARPAQAAVAVDLGLAVAGGRGRDGHGGGGGRRPDAPLLGAARLQAPDRRARRHRHGCLPGGRGGRRPRPEPARRQALKGQQGRRRPHRERLVAALLAAARPVARRGAALAARRRLRPRGAHRLELRLGRHARPHQGGPLRPALLAAQQARRAARDRAVGQPERDARGRAARARDAARALRLRALPLAQPQGAAAPARAAAARPRRARLRAQRGRGLVERLPHRHGGLLRRALRAGRRAERARLVGVAAAHQGARAARAGEHRGDARAGHVERAAAVPPRQPHRAADVVRAKGHRALGGAPRAAQVGVALRVGRVEPRAHAAREPLLDADAAQGPRRGGAVARGRAAAARGRAAGQARRHDAAHRARQPARRVGERPPRKRRARAHRERGEREAGGHGLGLLRGAAHLHRPA
eukprot:scaffold90469_cov63-Phaeocystis_antarctica.AAC.2